MNNWKKIALLTIIISCLLALLYCGICSIWFASSVREYIDDMSFLSCKKMTFGGLNKITIKDIEINAPIPITAQWDVIRVTSNRLMFTKAAEYQVVISFGEGKMVFGQEDESFEGYTVFPCYIQPFDIVFTVHENGIKFLSGECRIEKVGMIAYDVDLAHNYLSLLSKVTINKSFINNAPDPKFFKNAVQSDDKELVFDLQIEGDLPLLRVNLQSSFIEMTFAYSLE
ncbi:hypothetical protein ACFL3D_03585 [Candidatus Omnitrophota bacterium]